MTNYKELLKGWQDGMTSKDELDLAYAERNMLALLLCNIYNDLAFGITNAGWYYDTENNWDGWKRVLSFEAGKITFHIPDDFDIGNLPQIKPNWDGHTTEQKWNYVRKMCRMEEF